MLTRCRQDLVRTRIVLANQLRDQLACFWPGASKVFTAVDSKIALAFLRRYPSPADARGLGEQRLAAFLTKHGYTGRKPAKRSWASCVLGLKDARASSRPGRAGRSSWPWSALWSRSLSASAS